MNRKDFLNLVAKNAELPRYETRIFYDAFIKTLMEVLESGDYVSLPGFGRFCIKDFKSYVAFNPHNREEQILVPPYKRVKFEQSIVLKKYLNNGKDKEKESKDNE